MPVPTWLMNVCRNFAILAAAVGWTLGSAQEARSQQPVPSLQPAPCLGYAYNIRPARLVAGGVQTVAEVLPGTPAEAGGLQPGDILVSVAGVPTNSGRSPTLVPGDTIPFVVSREGRNVTLTMVVGQRQPVPSGDPVCRPVARESPRSG